jgi:hypothetical protein
MSPDLRRKVDANRAARLAQEQTIKRQIDAQVSIFKHVHDGRLILIQFLYCFRTIQMQGNLFGQTNKISGSFFFGVFARSLPLSYRTMCAMYSFAASFVY